jgi:hypothetical protein
MDFSARAKKVFYQELGLNNRQISKRMENYNETMISRYMNDTEPSATFVKKIKKYFPELAHIDWFDEDNGEGKLKVLHEKGEEYLINTVKKIDRIINELEEIKDRLSQK